MIDPRIDDYIEKAQLFSQPVLIRLRELIHKACPEVTETIKWGMPSFEYIGPLCNFASFKQHCVFGFWKSSLLEDPGNYLKANSVQGGEAMGNFGRMTSVKDMPSAKAILDLIKQAMQLNKDGIKIEKKKTAPKTAPASAELQAALNKNTKAKFFFEKFSPSQQKEYNEWISDAKTDVTRNKRLYEALTWISEGKARHWKYQKKKK